MENSVLHTFC